MCGKEIDAYEVRIAIPRLRPAAVGNGFDHVWIKWNQSKHTSKQCNHTSQQNQQLVGDHILGPKCFLVVVGNKQNTLKYS